MYGTITVEAADGYPALLGEVSTGRYSINLRRAPGVSDGWDLYLNGTPEALSAFVARLLAALPEVPGAPTRVIGPDEVAYMAEIRSQLEPWVPELSTEELLRVIDQEGDESVSIAHLLNARYEPEADSPLVAEIRDGLAPWVPWLSADDLVHGFHDWVEPGRTMPGDYATWLSTEYAPRDDEAEARGTTDYEEPAR